MKVFKSIAILLTVFAPLAVAKDKKKDTLPALFSNARYVYVQAEDGDIMKPGLFPEDRDAIANVQDTLKGWPRYSLTLNRKDADLIIIVRKGRLASAQVHGAVTAGAPTATPTAPIPPDDILRVFSLSPEGKLSGPLWSSEMKDGLDAPNVMLLRALRDAVDRAYPPQPAAQKKP